MIGFDYRDEFRGEAGHHIVVVDDEDDFVVKGQDFSSGKYTVFAKCFITSDISVMIDNTKD